MAACASQGSSYSAVIWVAEDSALTASPSLRKVCASDPERTAVQSAAVMVAVSAVLVVCQAGARAAAARRACQVPSATTPTAAADPASEGRRTTPSTPGRARAAVSSSDPSTVSRCGACTKAA